MKSVSANHLSAVSLTVALALISFIAVYPAAAQNNAAISKKELKVLLKTAKTPAEHEKIAAYYQHEAARLTQSARDHQELAAIYKQAPPNSAMESKHGSAVEGALHCDRWAQLDGQQAKEAEALAGLHESMAKDAGKK